METYEKTSDLSCCGSFRWAFSKSSFRVINPTIVSVDILIEMHPFNRGELIITRGNDIIKQNVDGGKSVLHIDINGPCDITISGKTFVPKRTNPSSPDDRELSFKGREFIVTDREGTATGLTITELPVVYHSSKMDEVKMELSGPKPDSIDYTPKLFDISKPIKSGAVLYLDKPYTRIIQQLSDYPMSKTSDVVTFSDNPSVKSDIKCDPFVSIGGRRYDYAFQAILKAAEIAKERGWDYFMWLEWDCYVGKDYWYDVLWNEMLGWPYEPIMAGTPTVSYQTVEAIFNS